MRAAVVDAVTRGRRRLRLRWPLRAAQDAPAAETAPAPVTATSYRTFSYKIAPSLTAAGGALALAGALGAWIRATQVTVEGLAAEEVALFLGREDPFGYVLAFLGAVAAAASLLWLTRWRVLKVLPVVVAAGLLGLIGWRLVVLGDRLSETAAAARETQALDFAVFHVGLGWGAWLLIVAAIVLFLGTSVGVMRELDVRKGIGDG